MSQLMMIASEAVTPWWTNGGMVGGIMGSAVGILGGGIYGPLVGVCAPRGIMKGFVMGYHFAMLALGVVLLGTGLVAVSIGQPYAVWYPLVLCGGLMSVLMTMFTPMLRTRYRQAEHRKLEAEEFRRSGQRAEGAV